MVEDVDEVVSWDEPEPWLESLKEVESDEPV
jgi:hypothetical protein